MCHRITPLTLEEVEEALAHRARGERATVPHSIKSQPKVDAYPRSQVPAIVPCEDGRLKAALMTWGFWSAPRGGGGSAGPGADHKTEGSASLGASGGAAGSAGGKVIFNTRLDTALRQMRDGAGMWAQAIARGRCLIPVRAFYEQGRSVPGPTGAPVTQPYRFTLAGSNIFLLAGVAEDGRFSIVTTAPKREVAPVHNRMPLVLAPGESSRWLSGDFAPLADRTHIALAVTPA